MSKARVGLVSFDVEEWFHILDTTALPPPEAWPNLRPCVERNVHRILSILRQSDARATFFVVGWVGRRYPRLIRDIATEGHEIASHSDRHVNLQQANRRLAREEIIASKDALEQITGGPVRGFRAPGFSVHPQDAWLLDVVGEAGYAYDSSISPAHHAHGSGERPHLAPYVIALPSGRSLYEIPPSAIRIAAATLPFGGGGYLRAYPAGLTLACGLLGATQGRPFVSYIHPRDLDSRSPSLPLGCLRVFKSRVGVHTTAGKLRLLLRLFPNITYWQYVQAHSLPLPAAGPAAGAHQAKSQHPASSI